MQCIERKRGLPLCIGLECYTIERIDLKQRCIQVHPRSDVNRFLPGTITVTYTRTINLWYYIMHYTFCVEVAAVLKENMSTVLRTQSKGRRSKLSPSEG